MSAGSGVVGTTQGPCGHGQTSLVVNFDAVKQNSGFRVAPAMLKGKYRYLHSATPVFSRGSTGTARQPREFAPRTRAIFFCGSRTFRCYFDGPRGLTTPLDTSKGAGHIVWPVNEHPPWRGIVSGRALLLLGCPRAYGATHTRPLFLPHKVFLWLLLWERMSYNTLQTARRWFICRDTWRNCN